MFGKKKKKNVYMYIVYIKFEIIKLVIINNK